jgi:hypothetical protein
MKNIIGIDPGSGGGLCIRTQRGEVKAFNMPQTDLGIVNLLRDLAVSPPLANVVFLEDLVKHMGPGTPASTMAVYASNWGTIKGACLMAGFKLNLITPQKWQKGLNLGNTGRLQVPRAPNGSTKLQKKLFKEINAQEIKRIQDINDGLKRDWKRKLKETAMTLYPELSVTLKKADAILIMEFGIRTTDDVLI